MRDEFKRKLTAILSADVVGYSRLMSRDDVTTVQRITTYRELIGTRVREHHGRVVDSPGDNLLAEFPSAIDAARCAIEIQGALKNRNADLPTEHKMEFRIGIHLGDVLVDGERIYGDGVNIAARLESLAEHSGISISDAVYNQVKNKLSLRFENQGEHTVKNIEDPVQVYRVVMESETIQKDKIKIETDADKFKLPEGPSIAVLPFVNMSGDDSQEYICDGLTENIITSLSNNPKFLVIASNSCFHFKGKSPKIQEVAKELDVRYVLEGSFQKAGARVRINAQLIDTKTGHHLWAEKYDRNFEDLFELQDEITEKIFTALAVKLTDGESVNISSKYPASFEARLKMMKAGCYYNRLNKEGNILARKEMERAMSLSPEHPGPYVLIAWTHLNESYYYPDKTSINSLEQATKYAKLALEIDETNPDPYCVLSHVSMLNGDYQNAISYSEQAINLNPNYGLAYLMLGLVYTRSGTPQKGVDLFKKAFQLNPMPPSMYFLFLGNAYYLLGRYQKAIEYLKKAIEIEPDGLFSRINLAVTYSLVGDEDKARSEVSEVFRIEPSFSLVQLIDKLPYKNKEESKRIFEALRKAGLE